MKKSEIYPISLRGIKQTGIDKWLQDYQPNISCGEYQRIYSLILDSFLKFLPDKNSRPLLYYALISNFKTTFSISQVLYEYTTLEAIQCGGYRYVRDTSDEEISGVMRKLCTKGFPKTAVSRLPVQEICKEYWRFLKINWRECSLIDFALAFKGSADYCLVGDRKQKELKTFAAENDIRPVCLRPALFFRNTAHAKKEHENDATEFARLFLDEIIVKFPQSHAVIDNKFREDLSAAITYSINALVSCVKILPDRTDKSLLVTTVGNIYHRIFASAWKMRGGRTIGFSHGNIYPYAYMPGDILNGSMAILDEFVVCSEGERKLLEYADRDFSGGIRNKIKFTALKYPVYRHIYDEVQKARPVKAVRKIMYIGYPMDYLNQARLPDHNTLSFLRLEISVLETLRKEGYHVMYKAHPDTISETSCFFKGLCDEIITEKFENVYAMADCIVFGTPYSTTFGYALMTNRPVVLLNNNRNCWYPELFPLLQKRVSLVSAELKEHGVIDFNKDELLNAVKYSAVKMDYEIVEKFAL